MEGNKTLQAALGYLRRGWSVIPLGTRGKKPLIKWEEFQSRRATEDEVTAWFEEFPTANIAIVTGRISGIVVLDVDGDEGRETIKGLAIPPTPCSSTGHGLHYIFAHPGREVRNFAKEMPGLDFRGDGGYIVAPPSVHPSGAKYEWKLDPEFAEPDTLPKWLDDLLTEKANRQGDHTPRVDVDEIWSGVGQGERNQKLFQYACRLRAKRMTYDEAEQLILGAALQCNPPLHADEART